MERKLASIQRVLEVKKHPNADTLDLITVLGWQMVNKSGQLSVGDLCVFFEIDAVLPIIPEFAFLEKVKYRIKTCKLRGEVSQGLVMPLSILTTGRNLDWKYVSAQDTPLNVDYLVETVYKVDEVTGEKHIDGCVSHALVEGLDVTEALGVRKHDPDVQGTFRLSSVAKGKFPEWLRKTDAERFQSVGQSAIEEFHGKVFGYSLKVDGTSFTAYLKDGEFGVCSRNLDLKKVEPKESLYWLIAEKYDLEYRLKAFVEENPWGIRNIAIQGEILGPSVQKNRLKLLEPEMQVFDVFDIDKREYVRYADELAITERLGLKHVELIDSAFVFDKEIHTVSFFLKLAEGTYKSTDGPREGLVFKSMDGLHSNALRDRMKFKIINNEYLLKYVD